MPPRSDIHIPLFPSGVGSVSETDPDQAVAAIFARYWRMPFWPQLPNRTPLEMMIPPVWPRPPGR